MQKITPELKRDHYRQQFSDDVMLKLAEIGSGKRGAKVLPVEIVPLAGAACVHGEEQTIIKPRQSLNDRDIIVVR